MMEEIIFSKEFIESDDCLAFLLEQCLVPETTIIDIEMKTLGQWSNPIFCQLRSFRLTGSKFGVILKAIHRNKEKRASFCKTLMASLLGDKVYKAKKYQEKPKQIARGHDHEDEASEKWKTKLPNCEIQKCDTYLHEFGILLASPDGQSNDFAVEIKCLWSRRASKDLKVFL